MKQKQITNRYLFLAVLTLSMAVSACNETILGSGFKSEVAGPEAIESGSSGVVVDDGEVDMSKLDSELDALESDLSNIESKLKGLSIVGLSTNNVGTNAVGKDLKGFYEKLLNGIKKVKDQVANLRTQIEARLGQLDPNNPLHKKILDKLNLALSYLDQLEDKVAQAVTAVLGVADMAIAKVDQALAKMDPKSPLTWVASAAWAALKIMILEYRDKLLLALSV